MRIHLITPAKRGSRAGNRATAVRWAAHLRALGHRVTVATDYAGDPGDAMIALHAWRSARAIQKFARLYPGRPLIVALTGTDIHRFQYSHPQPTLRSMALADALITLHGEVAAHIPKKFRKKISIVHQSALPLARERKPLPRSIVRSARASPRFEICVIGHLRMEKDPLRAAYAARLLSRASRARVTQLGQAVGPDWERAAKKEAGKNSRYRWLGEVSHARVRQVMGRSRVMVISSVMEGGANVVSEACVAGLPVIASRIPGNVGLLGRDYPGYFPVKDTPALARLLRRVETNPEFLARLARRVKARARLFRSSRERTMLQAALARAVGAAKARSGSDRDVRSAPRPARSLRRGCSRRP